MSRKLKEKKFKISEKFGILTNLQKNSKHAKKVNNAGFFPLET